MTLPDLFKIQMKNILGAEYQDFEDALQKAVTPSVRLNPFKSETQLPLADPVEWCKDGYYLKERPNFTLDPFFHAGHYYVQEASSMFIDYILRNIQFKTNSKVLDLCSAPGGKSTLLLSYLATEGFLHCHEFDSFRAGILKQNIERWGYPNAIVTSGALTQLEKLDARYDLILIDAPCSGEGMFRKEPEALKQWNENKVNHCSHLQKNIMNIADTLCAEDGYIIYSTCTWNRRENEEILYSYVSNGTYEPVRITNKFAISEFYDTTYTYRLFPHKIEGEGFTVSVLKKRNETLDFSYESKKEYFPKLESRIKLEDWMDHTEDLYPVLHRDLYYGVSKSFYSQINQILQLMHVKHLGIPIGNYKGTDFYPSHGLSQSIYLNKNLPEFALSYDEALSYLKSLTPSLTVTSNQKWFIASYRSAKLGWLKNGGSGIKNYYPINQRIISF